MARWAGGVNFLMDELGAATVLSLEEAEGLEKALKVREGGRRKEGTRGKRLPSKAEKNCTGFSKVCRSSSSHFPFLPLLNTSLLALPARRRPHDYLLVGARACPADTPGLSAQAGMGGGKGKREK